MVTLPCCEPFLLGEERSKQEEEVEEEAGGGEGGARVAVDRVFICPAVLLVIPLNLPCSVVTGVPSAAVWRVHVSIPQVLTLVLLTQTLETLDQPVMTSSSCT